jgi:tRNA-specific 2-thiouridylase
MLERADELGIDFISTGHYARVVDGAICRSATKDQSYALFELPRTMLRRILLPVGEVADKVRIRHIAESLCLPVADKPDSQEICFVSGDYVELLRQRRPEGFRPGEIVDTAGHVLGRHEGVAAFTIGQRRGLGKGIEDAVHRIWGPTPMYVTKIDAANARVTIGPKSATFSRRLSASEVNWHIDEPPVGWEFQGIVQIRYNHAGAPARVTAREAGRFEVEFDEPISAITPGQGVAIYDGQRLLGGGWIE